MNLLLGVLFVGKACLIFLSRQSPHSVWMAADFAALRIFHFQNRYKIKKHSINPLCSHVQRGFFVIKKDGT